jgi:hypothetical protein
VVDGRIFPPAEWGTDGLCAAMMHMLRKCYASVAQVLARRRRLWWELGDAGWELGDAGWELGGAGWELGDASASLALRE